ncbi:MAG TPA: hypothetical protein VMU26_27645 [Candidatus Polarisedimenticolia bacterium]|nr:hypothetical protein [Candidatus Polarisedimenticolia bacterium]
MDTVIGTLVLTFRGPFVYHVQPATIDVYAPICANHRASISTANAEYPFCGRQRNGGDYTYALDPEGVHNNLGNIKYPGSGGSQCNILASPPNKTVDTSQCRFRLTVPRPTQIYRLNATTTSVMKDNSTVERKNWATGLSFYYSCDLTKYVSLITPEKSSVDLSFDSDMPSLPNYADINVQHVGPDADDAEHLDAISCFDQTMKILNLPWWLYYGQGGLVIDARTGADCHSLAVVLDPNVTRSEI